MGLVHARPSPATLKAKLPLSHQDLFPTHPNDLVIASGEPGSLTSADQHDERKALLPYALQCSQEHQKAEKPCMSAGCDESVSGCCNSCHALRGQLREALMQAVSSLLTGCLFQVGIGDPDVAWNSTRGAWNCTDAVLLHQPFHHLLISLATCRCRQSKPPAMRQLVSWSATQQWSAAVAIWQTICFT